MRNFVQVHALIACKDAPRLQHLAASTRSQVLACWEQDVVVVQTLHGLAHEDAVDVVNELALGGVDEALLAHVVGVYALVADEHLVIRHPAPAAGRLVVPPGYPGRVLL